MSQILSGLEGVVCQMDDVLVFGSDKRQHDAVLERIEVAGAALNEKCEFCTTSVKFLGHLIDQKGIRADPEKARAIREMPTPTSVTGLCCFMGMVNQLEKLHPACEEMDLDTKMYFTIFVSLVFMVTFVGYDFMFVVHLSSQSNTLPSQFNTPLSLMFIFLPNLTPLVL
jgi:hypothetical protein